MRLALIGSIILSLLSSTAWAQDLPGIGTTARGSIGLGARTFPVLDGDWTVAAVQETSSSSNTPVGHVVLAQLSDGKLSRWIYLSTNFAWNNGGWKRKKDVCDRKNVHFGYSDQFNSTKETECWILNQNGETLGNNASQVWVDFYRWSDSRGRPNTSLMLDYYLVKNGNFLHAEYHFNPVLAGFPDTPTAAWRGSPWHVDIASKDARKLDYLRGLKAIGDGLFGQLKTSLK